MRSLAMGVAATLWASTALAADKLEIGPAGSWVQVAEVPKVMPQAGAAALQVLLSDHQDRFGDDGQESYVRSLFLVSTPQGLAALSNMSVTWRPDTDAVTVHYLHIIRGDKIIDLLADQSFTVLRRETNLELAILNGDLTAAIQPEGLETGDVVDFAYTLKRRDPTLQGKSEFLSAFSLPIPAGRLRVREVWLAAKPMRWRTTTGFSNPVLAKTAAGSELLLDEHDLQPLTAPAFAPPRFLALRQIEVTEFRSWNEVSALMAPLFAKAATLKPDSPLKAEAAKIAAATSDPKARAAAALKLVEDKVRYVFLGMNLGGYVPASADQTWSRRFGDCKGKTAVLLALLHEFGIEAEPSLISVGAGDGLDERLPMLELFDHVLARTTIGGRTYWLDATRTGDGAIDQIAVPNFHWTLPVRPAGAALERLMVPPLTEPMSETRIHFDASGGLDGPAPAHIEYISRKDAAVLLRQGLANLTPADLETKLKAYWKERYDWIEPTKVAAIQDQTTGDEILMLDGSAKLSWTNAGENRREYELDGATLGWKADLSRTPGPNTNAPYAVDYPSYDKTVETIILPANGVGYEVVGADVDTRLAGMQFRRTTHIDKGVLTMDTSYRALNPEFPVGEATAAQKGLRALHEVTVYVKTPNVKTQAANAAELNHMAATKPTTAADYITRASALLDKHETQKAIADYDRAVAMEPQTGFYVRLRGFAWLETDPRRALVDFAKALELVPTDSNAMRGQGFAYLRLGRYAEAVKSLDTALAIEPNNAFSLKGRGEARAALNDYDSAMADLGEALRINPDDPDIYFARAMILVRHDQRTLADAELDKMIARNPKSANAFALRGEFMFRNGRGPEAIRAYDQAIALTPSAVLFAYRALSRPQAERAARLADVDQALKLDPKSATAHMARAAIFVSDKDYDGAVREYDTALTLSPGDADLAIWRIQALVGAGKVDDAIAGLDKLIAATPDNPDLLNNRCWTKATANRDLPGALADCEAAIKIAPDAATMIDSRAFVKLRLGRLDEAIADYDTALKANPKLAPSLFGRGLAKLRLGKTQEGQADLTAARKLYPKIDEEFAGYGLKP